LGNNKPADPKNEAGARPFFPGDFVACIDSKGEPVSVGEEKTMVFPLADIDFWCINNDKSLVPTILQGDVIALKRLSSWKEYIPGEFICVVVTADYKVLRKVAVTQDDENSICFVQMVDGNPVESHIPKDIIVEIYKVVGNYRAQSRPMTNTVRNAHPPTQSKNRIGGCNYIPPICEADHRRHHTIFYFILQPSDFIHHPFSALPSPIYQAHLSRSPENLRNQSP